MRVSLRILTRDIRRLLGNWASALVIGGVCLLPSLYAWFNIAANMDPYANTSGIQVAIANCDEGADTELITMNAGESIVEKLEENDSLGWQFVSEQEAKEGVRAGDYYAAIVIPEDFSESLVSLLSGSVETPKLDYYVNEKKNSIAPKITDTGATTIQQQINDTFLATASEAISEIVSSSADTITGGMDESQSELTQTIAEVKKNLDEYEQLVEDFGQKVEDADDQIARVKTSLDLVDLAAKNGSDALAQTETLMTKSRTSLGKFYRQLTDSITGTVLFADEVSASASQKLNRFETKADAVTETVGEELDAVTEIAEKNADLLESLENLNENIGSSTDLSESLTRQLAQLKKQNTAVENALDSLKTANKGVQTVIENSKSTRLAVEEIASDGRDSLVDTRVSFDEDIYPEFDQSLAGLAELTGSVSSTVSGATAVTAQMRVLLDEVQAALQSSVQALEQTENILGQVEEKLESISTDLSALQSSDMYQNILSLEGIDAQNISEFMSSPVTISSEVLYDVENYGTGMTPFYTNLALWVGGLILVSILKQEVDRDEQVPDFSPTSAYFGRVTLFVVIGLIQGFIVCAGDLLLLKVQCLHPAKFIFAGMLTSFVYVNLIFALALTFKHIGKAVAVLLVILQIPGSSGTYPIEMMPEFFQFLHPLLPFSYSINAMRECIAGFYGNTYTNSLWILLIFLAVAFFIGLVLRPVMMNLNHLFDKRLEKTDLMLGETDSKSRDNPQLRRVMRVIMQDDAWREKITQKAAVFEKRYPILVRAGFVCVVVVPMVFLVLMFSLESKLVFLILWIVSLLAVILYLIIVEYIHEEMEEKSLLGKMTEEELMNVFKEERK